MTRSVASMASLATPRSTREAETRGAESRSPRPEIESRARKLNSRSSIVPWHRRSPSCKNSCILHLMRFCSAAEEIRAPSAASCCLRS